METARGCNEKRHSLRKNPARRSRNQTFEQKVTKETKRRSQISPLRFLRCLLFQMLRGCSGSQANIDKAARRSKNSQVSSTGLPAIRSEQPPMSRYVDSTQQLVVELS